MCFKFYFLYFVLFNCFLVITKTNVDIANNTNIGFILSPVFTYSEVSLLVSSTFSSVLSVFSLLSSSIAAILNVVLAMTPLIL